MSAGTSDKQRVLKRQKNVRLAQLDRAFGYGPKGRGFESSNARHKKMGQDIKSCPIFYSSPVGLERVRSTFHFVSVPLRSVQSQHPPDVVNRC